MAGRKDPLLAAYLRQLDDAARVLPGGQRSELVSEIRAHLADALPADAGEAAVRDALDRLGSPEDIVAAAIESAPEQRIVSATPGRLASAWLELAAVLLMTVGSVVIPVLGWLIGVALMWTSRHWRLREKLIGTLLVPGGIGGVAVYVFALGSVASCFSSTSQAAGGRPVTVSSCSGGPGPLQEHLRLAAVVAAAVLALVVPFVLFVIARRRVDAETHVVYASA